MTPSVDIALDGFSYRYRWVRAEGGRGVLPPVVFLGGAFQSIESWRCFSDAFSAEADVLLVDLPGSGRADPLPPEYDLDFLTDALFRVVEHIGVPPAYVVGASYGSPVGYRFAQRFPERVSHLVMAGVMDKLTAGARAAMEAGIALAGAGRMEAFADHTSGTSSVTTRAARSFVEAPWPRRCDAASSG